MGKYDKGNNRRSTSHTITLEEYKALEAEGRIKRPLTDYPMEVKRRSLTPHKKISTIDEFIANQDKD